jgi:hypothetical protein
VNVSFNATSELLTSFSKKYNLRIERDECGDPVIPGQQGQLYEYGPAELGLIILDHGGAPSPRLWKTAFTKCLSAGMTLRQCGDAEGALSFDPSNKYQARLAIHFAGVRPKKQISEAHKAKLLAGLRKYQNSRSEAILEGALAC